MGSRTANDEKALAWVKKSGAEQFNLKIVR